MKKSINQIASIICVMFFSLALQAQNTGVFQTYAVLDVDGTGNQFLAGGLNPDGGTSYNGTDFGNVTTLVLNGGEVKTFKNGGGDVFGAEISYNVHLASDATESFSTINLPFNADLGGGNQRWQEAGAGVDLLSGLPSGTYHLEVFWRSPTSEGDRFDSDPGNNNYTATFTVANAPSGASADIVLTPSSSSVIQCDEFTVLVSVVSVDTYNTVEARLNFDPNELQIVEVTAPDGSNVLTGNPLFDQAGGPATEDNSTGLVAYTAGATTDITGDSDFMRITFEVIGNGGTTSITPITTGFPRSRVVISEFVDGIAVATDILTDAPAIDLTLNPDLELPTFDCVTAPSVTTDAGACSYTVQGTEFDPTTVDDNCGIATIENDFNNTASLANAVLTDGQIVTWTITDSNNNSDQCSFTVTVVDNEVPVISCVSDFTIALDENGQATINQDGSVDLANSENDFSPNQGENNWEYGTYPFNNFAAFTLLTYDAGDNRYEGTGSFETPFITATNGHPNVDNNELAVRRWTSNFAGTVTLSGEFQDVDLGGGDGVNVRIYQNGIEIYQYLDVPGSVITYSQSATVSVGDEIDFVVDAKFNADNDNTRFTANISAGGVSATDNCGVQGITASDASFDCTEVGANTITFTATDPTGNSAVCTATITVVDNIAPSITCNAAISVNNDTGICGAVVTYTNSSTDNCTGETIAQTAGLPSGATFPAGTTTNTFVVTDASGNTATCSFDVTVADTEAPVADVASLPNATGECSATVAAPAATDNCEGAITATTTDPLIYNDQGTFTVTWTYDDGNGNTSSQTQTVIVDDVTAPVADVASLTNATGECSATVTAPTATDNCEGSITATTTDPLTYTDQGTFTVTWTYDDGNGNTSSQTQTVIVDDVTAPVADVASLPNATGECSATVTAPTATDNCEGAITATTTDPLIYTDQGTFTVTWTYDDGNGNTSSQTQTVIVDDVTAPVADVASLPNETGECSATVTAPTATDNCEGAITATTTDPLIYNDQGTFTVTWTYDDGNGNTSSQTQTVIVDDVTAPAITCAANDSRTVNQINDTYLASGGEFDATATDNCLGVVTISHDAGVILTPQVGPNSTSLDGWEFPVGTTTITFTATDVEGNASTCTVEVTVDNVEVSGTLTLNGACLPLDMTISLYEPGTPNPAPVLAGTFADITIDPSGDFSFDASGIVPGSYDVYIKVDRYLTEFVGNYTISNAATGITGSGFRPGDISDLSPDLIDGLDLSILIDAYNTIPADAAYDDRADLNCDNVVDALDLSLLIFFFLDNGDSPLSE